MSAVREIFERMSDHYVSGQTDKTLVYYFSVGEEKWTVTLDPEKCVAKPGKLTDSADCVVKADPKLFVNMVVKGKAPGAMDIMRGKLKTNDIPLLSKMKDFFKM